MARRWRFAVWKRAALRWREAGWLANAQLTGRAVHLRSRRYERFVLACPAEAREASEGWWGKKDSNLRSHTAADLQSAPFATRDTPPLDGTRSGPLVPVTSCAMET